MLSPGEGLDAEHRRAFSTMYSAVLKAPSVENRGAWPTAELSGLEERDVEVLLQDGVLSVRGEKRIEKESGNKTFNERYYGRFERQIGLDRDINESAIHATFRYGVLTVTVPKTAQAVERTKRIPINTGGKSH